MADRSPAPVSLEDVLAKEYAEIEAVRKKRLTDFNQGARRMVAAVPERAVASGAPAGGAAPNTRTDDPGWAQVIKQAHEANYVGLALSGGGIRSATFNLGVLQALADLKLLCRLDYLSTVSGGGYIGSWLVAWCQRRGSFAKVQEEISTHRVHLKGDKEQPAVRFLRVFSNYLTPALGFFSGDTWAMVSIYLRNLLLNLTILMGMLATLILLPRGVCRLAKVVLGSGQVGQILIEIGAAMLLVALVMIMANMGYLGMGPQRVAPRFTEQKWVLVLVSAPLFLTAVVTGLWFLHRPEEGAPVVGALAESFPYQDAVLAGAIAYAAIWGLAWLIEFLFFASRRRTLREVGEGLIAGAAALLAGALGGWLLALIDEAQFFKNVPASLTYCVPLVVGVFLLAGALHMGLMGIVFRDWKREWWGRLGGWLLLFALVWLALFWLAMFFPEFIRTAPLVKTTWHTIATKYLTPAWLLTTLGSVLGGKSKASGKPGERSWVDTAIEVGPYVFGVGLLCWISFALDWFLHGHGELGWTLLGCAGGALVMAWRVDINQFSMHMFYRNRLVSCYLGASHEDRRPNRFTGFDPGDDLALKDLRHDAAKPYDGPYPVLNTALNLVKGKDLAWQERKAESFVMTPHYCGYDVWLEEQDSPMLTREHEAEGKGVAGNAAAAGPGAAAAQVAVPAQAARRSALERFGYRRTEDYAFPVPKYHGPNLGLAMATSGAAVSPNMGYHTSTPVSFLLTVFDVRLGQWMGNPRHRRTSRRATPGLGLWWLINELLGGTNDQAAYVYLSDGGHFDNMGLYELVKRRCGLIIVCDAEADPNYTFSGLGSAISKCRIDLGIDIELDTRAIAPKTPGGASERHCAIGKVHYENTDRDARTGTLVYFKASLTGDEPADVNNYKKEHPDFPHESTADQWFRESQFESYRELGYHEVVSSIRGSAGTPSPLEGEMQAILTSFGFEIERSRPLSHTGQRGAHGAGGTAPAFPEGVGSRE